MQFYSSLLLAVLLILPFCLFLFKMSSIYPLMLCAYTYLISGMVDGSDIYGNALDMIFNHSTVTCRSFLYEGDMFISLLACMMFCIMIGCQRLELLYVFHNWTFSSFSCPFDVSLLLSSRYMAGRITAALCHIIMFLCYQLLIAAYEDLIVISYNIVTLFSFQTS